MKKLKVSFYTNIPTPYQNDFFADLAAYVQLTVVYSAHRESDRQWDAVKQAQLYETYYLQDSRLARFLQRWIVDYHFSWNIFSIISKDQADYVIVSGAYWMPNAIIAMLLARWRGKKVAFFGERLAGPSKGVKAALKRMLLWPVRYSCSRVFSVGQEAADSYAAFGVNQPKTVVPYSINVERFVSERPVSKGETQPFTLLSVGSLITRKGMDTLIQAVRLLDTKYYPNLRLLILGDGPERSSLQRLIGDDDRIQLLGFKNPDELPIYFKEADAFVFASRYDGWGVVINEAIAAGLPVISSDAVGATREWIQDGINGFVCPVDDVVAFSEAIRKLVDDPELRVRQAAYNQQFRNKISSVCYARLVHQVIIDDLTL